MKYQQTAVICCTWLTLCSITLYSSTSISIYAFLITDITEFYQSGPVLPTAEIWKVHNEDPELDSVGNADISVSLA